MTKSIRAILLESLSDEARRAAVIMIAAPSGRHPSVMSTSPGGDRSIDERPYPVKFGYSVDYIRRGKRRTVRSWVEDRGYILPRLASTSEVQTAFYLRGYHDAEEITEIVHFDGDLWWSLPSNPSASQFMDGLAAGDHTAVGLLNPAAVPELRPAASVGDLEARTIEVNRRDEILAGVQKGAQDLLIVDGRRVFVRDGSPVYVLWSPNTIDIGKTTFRISRAFYRGRSCAAYEDVTNMLGFGRIFNPQERSAAMVCAERIGLSVTSSAHIETVLAECIRTDPISLQIDTLFRKLVELFKVRRDLPSDAAEEIGRVGRLLQQLSRQDYSSRDRALGLKSFVEWCDEGPLYWKTQFRVERRFSIDAIAQIGRQCQERNHPDPLDTILSPDDELAIAELSN